MKKAPTMPERTTVTVQADILPPELTAHMRPRPLPKARFPKCWAS